MNRSEFLKLSAQGMVTTAFLLFPKGASSQTVPGKELVFAKKFKSDETGKFYAIRCTINDKYEKDASVVLEIGQQDSEYGDPTERKAMTFTIRKVIDHDKGGYTLIKIKRFGKPRVEGNFRSFPELSALDNTKCIMVKEEEIIFKQKKSETGYTIPKYVPSSSGSGGCYLTTACTQHKGLPDDCTELQTLRTFRDNFVRLQKDGETTVAQYYELAPRIVDAIEAHQEKDEILAFIYDRLVSPSMNLLAQGETRLAMEYYKEFSWELSRRLPTS